MIVNRSLVNLINEIHNMLLEICVEEPRKSWGKEQIVGIKERMLMIIIMTYPECDPSPKPADEGRRLACPRKPLKYLELCRYRSAQRPQLEPSFENIF